MSPQRFCFLQEDPWLSANVLSMFSRLSFINNMLLLLTWSEKTTGDGTQTRKPEQKKRNTDWGTPRAGKQGCGNAKHLTSFLLLPPTCSLWSNVTSPQDVKTPPATHLYPSSLPLLFYWTLFLRRLPFYCHPSPYLSPLLPCFFSVPSLFTDLILLFQGEGKEALEKMNEWKKKEYGWEKTR